MTRIQTLIDLDRRLERQHERVLEVMYFKYLFWATCLVLAVLGLGTWT